MIRDIVFLMPARGLKPAGGFKIAFNYAEHFSELGHNVHIIYPYVNYNFSKEKHSLLNKCKIVFGYFLKLVLRKNLFQTWFRFKQPIRQHCIFILNKSMLDFCKGETVVFATAVDTAYALNEIKSIPDKNKFYLIQGFENWDFEDQYVYNSYKFHFHKIVIAKWLAEQVKKVGEKAVIIQNGLDFSYFKMSNPIEERTPYEVAMLYHTSNVKRCVDAFAALDIVKKNIPNLHVSVFGSYDKPNLPDWYTYYKTPDKETHNMIYNNASVFVASSSTEGWGLTPCEAMQCGAAVACTDNGGYLEFAKHEETALVSKVYDVQSLADNIIRLISDNELRIRIAYSGNECVQQFTWENAYKKMDESLINRDID